MLDDSQIPPSELVDKWDIIIVSYNFVSGLNRAIEQYKTNFRHYRDGEAPPPLPPEAALLSVFWTIMNRPIKRLVLDGCHTFAEKNGGGLVAIRVVDLFGPLQFVAGRVNYEGKVARFRPRHAYSEDRKQCLT